MGQISHDFIAEGMNDVLLLLHGSGRQSGDECVAGEVEIEDN